MTMKTAVSIPDPIFDAAEQVAGRLGLSRSELYARALADFVRKHRNDKVTQALNEVYAHHSSKLDPVLEKIQYASLPREEW
jgi:metal-responsive CopG/Arc/MetJ family transcriptional regulator